MKGVRQMSNRAMGCSNRFKRRRGHGSIGSIRNLLPESEFQFQESDFERERFLHVGVQNSLSLLDHTKVFHCFIGSNSFSYDS